MLCMVGGANWALGVHCCDWSHGTSDSEDVNASSLHWHAARRYEMHNFTLVTRNIFRNKCIRLSVYADNVALLAFARYMPHCCAPCSNRLISPGHSSKPAATLFRIVGYAGSMQDTDWWLFCDAPSVSQRNTNTPVTVTITVPITAGKLLLCPVQQSVLSVRLSVCFICLWTHCRHVPINKIWRWVESTPRSEQWRSRMAGIYNDCNMSLVNNGAFGDTVAIE